MLSSSYLQIFSSSHPHTFSFANTHMPKSSNIDICSAKFSIFSRAGLYFFFILQTSPPPLNLRSSQFHTLSSAASRPKNNTHRNNVFQCCFWAKAEPQEQKTVSGVRSQGRKKNVSQCCFNPKTDLHDTAHFFQCGEKLVRVELTMRVQRGEEKVAQCCFLKPKTDPQEEK